MNSNKLFGTLIVALVLFSSFAGYQYGRQTGYVEGSAVSLGASSSTYSNALNTLTLYNFHNDIIQSLSNLKGSLESFATTTAWNPGAVTTSTSATTTITNTGLVAGDLCIAGLTTNSSTASGIPTTLSCQVLVNDTILVTLSLGANSTLSVNPDAGTLYVRGFKPTATSLTVSTTTNPAGQP